MHCLQMYHFSDTSESAFVAEKDKPLSGPFNLNFTRPKYGFVQFFTLGAVTFKFENFSVNQ